MEKVFDFLARFGEVMWGLVWFLTAIAFAVILLIELIDFLIVDPLRRNSEPIHEELGENS